MIRTYISHRPVEGSYKKIWLEFETAFWDTRVLFLACALTTAEPGTASELDTLGDGFLIFDNLFHTHGRPVLEAVLVGRRANLVFGCSDEVGHTHQNADSIRLRKDTYMSAAPYICPWYHLTYDTPQAIAAAVLHVLRRSYPDVAVPMPINVAVTRWEEDPLSRGAYSFFPPTATERDIKILAAPVGEALYFCGEATDICGQGSLHGAGASGVRAAMEVSRALARHARELGATATEKGRDGPRCRL